MKYAVLILSLYAANVFASTEILGSWPQKQQVEQATALDDQWLFSVGTQVLTLTAPPSAISQPKAGAWLELQVKHHPAGMMRKLLWSPSEQAQPCLIFGQNNGAIGEALPNGWRWEAGPTLVRDTQRIKLKIGKVSKIKGWSVLLTAVRPAVIAKAGEANESETRFDWWAQSRSCPN